MKIEVITSPHNTRFRNALKLHRSRGRRAQNRVLVIGWREINRAIAAGLPFEELFFLGNPTVEISAIREELKLTVPPTARCASLPDTLFEKLAYGDREAVAIGIAQRPCTELNQIAPLLSPAEENSLIVVLESLEKPGNLGAVARSADAGGVSAILVANTKTDIFHPNAIRSSVATVFSVPLGCGSTAEVQKFLSQTGYRIYYASPEASRSLYHTNFLGRVAIVIGNEAWGISPAWKTQDAQGIQVPMLGIGDSLNASVTASLVIYEAFRQRLGQNQNDP
jgi:TrmH family RNA methyltransferase